MLEYRSPDGNVTKNPAIAEIIERILNPDSKYWQEGSGEVSLVFHNPEGRKSLLIVFYDAKVGFFLEYRPDSTRHDRLFSIGDGNMKNLVTLYVSGEAHRLPIGVFVPGKFAAKAVGEFAITGSPSGDLKWQNRRELHWDDDSEDVQ